MASVESGGPIEFLIPGSGDDYLDLANTMLHVQAKVTRADGGDLDLADPVGPVNNWLHSLFNQVDVSERYARDPFDQHVSGYDHSHGCR